MNVRRIVLDVDKARARPAIPEIAAAIEAVPGVQALSITVTEIDMETVGMDVAVEGEHIEYERLIKAIETTGAVVHSIDELSCGDRVIDRPARVR
ncbi:MAG TPA: DUF211 domain-containing protein [Bryobacteraceae bacterium]|nr:DUF211 domain-containing protein [Bryobacteraceae bacterium]